MQKSLLKNLKCTYGIRGTAYSLINSYLSNSYNTNKQLAHESKTKLKLFISQIHNVLPDIITQLKST